MGPVLASGPIQIVCSPTVLRLVVAPTIGVGPGEEDTDEYEKDQNNPNDPSGSFEVSRIQHHFQSFPQPALRCKAPFSFRYYCSRLIRRETNWFHRLGLGFPHLFHATRAPLFPSTSLSLQPIAFILLHAFHITCIFIGLVCLSDSGSNR